MGEINNKLMSYSISGTDIETALLIWSHHWCGSIAYFVHSCEICSYF